MEGLGGMETKPHRNPVTPGPGGAWNDPSSDLTFYTQNDDGDQEEEGAEGADKDNENDDDREEEGGE